jgi:hypothetical protein
MTLSIPKFESKDTLDLTVGMVEWFKTVNFGDRGFEVFPVKALPPGEGPVLGRSFFSLACMLSDYDRGLFAITNQNMNYNGIAKKVATEKAFNPPKSNHGISKKLAIIVSTTVILSILLILTTACCLFRRRHQEQGPGLNGAKQEMNPERYREEVDGTQTTTPPTSQQPQHYKPVELEAPNVSELDDTPQRGRLKI